MTSDRIRYGDKHSNHRRRSNHVRDGAVELAHQITVLVSVRPVYYAAPLFGAANAGGTVDDLAALPKKEMKGDVQCESVSM